MKTKLLALLLLLAAPAAGANQVVAQISRYPAKPQTCASLGAHFGVTITSISYGDAGVVTLTCAPDWTPTSDQLTDLTNLLNDGQ
jgi:hypothetical protein